MKYENGWTCYYREMEWCTYVLRHSSCSSNVIEMIIKCLKDVFTKSNIKKISLEAFENSKCYKKRVVKNFDRQLVCNVFWDLNKNLLKSRVEFTSSRVELTLDFFLGEVVLLSQHYQTTCEASQDGEQKECF